MNLSKARKVKTSTLRKKYRVVDVTGVFNIILLMAIIFFGYRYGYPYAKETIPNWVPKSDPYDYVILVEAIIFIRLIVYMPGYLFDFKKKIIHFPGGGISPNSIFDIFKPWFLLQYFRRFSVEYEEIREIQAGAEESGLSQLFRSLSEKKQRPAYVYWIKINGSFGAARLRFSSEAKRDEPYSAIVVNNEMGQPVVIR